MTWWLQLIIIWLSIDIVILATGWYAVNTLKIYFPKWWERVIASEIEPDLDFEPGIAEAPSYMAKPKAVE